MKNNELSLELLTLKLTTLLALATGQRVQTLSLIELKNIQSSNKGIEIKIPKRIKTSNKNTFLSLSFYLEDPHVCVATTLLYYMEKTKPMRNLDFCQNLLMTFKKPYHNATSQTISRWVKKIMFKSGIDTTQFTAHSTRHASTSLAQRKGIPFDVIKSAAGWTNKSQTFAKFYQRTIRDPQSFAKAILGK